ncbi:LysR substrate-binding domain-containing protein [Proteiniclasticum sp. C24MP]|uniref:LysR family transcriptional regulator n=1 Tax=Proteiniclasticum sp. C24MP TaxID=3374101 RepID=UPI0037553F05
MIHKFCCSLKNRLMHQTIICNYKSRQREVLIMNILQLKYLVAIVENGFNITQASKELFISQPALSKSVSQMEATVNFMIFERHKGRLSHLTVDGQIIYDHAKRVLSEYDELMGIIELRSRSEEGEVVLGIPPLVITTLFTDFLNKIKSKNDQVKVTVLEYGGHTLEEMMKNEKINFAILVDSNLYQDDHFNFIDIHLSEFALYMSRNNELASKKSIHWTDLENKDIAIVDDTYSAHHIFQNHLSENNVKVKSMLTASSWDYLFASIKDQDTITFLPIAIQNLFNMKGIKATPFTEPVPWKISFFWRKRINYTSAQNYLIDYFKFYFKKKLD